jgi:hypothetical protein
MVDIGQFLAPHRTAVWLEHRDRYLENMNRVWHLLRTLSSGIDWHSLAPNKPSILAVYFGSIVNHQFTLHAVGQEMVWCCMIGAPAPETKTQVRKIIEQSSLDGLIRIDDDPPSPSHPSYCLMLYGLLVCETLISMEGGNSRDYDRIIGIEVVRPDEVEVTLLTALLNDEALPTLLRVMGRNLRRWINEPKLNADVSRLIQHAYELRYIGAVRAAGVAAGTALELLLTQWSGIPAERIKAERTMLGKLIVEAQKVMNLPQSTIIRMRTFSELRAKCAHALVDSAVSDSQLGEEVDNFLAWLSENIRT